MPPITLSTVCGQRRAILSHCGHLPLIRYDHDEQKGRATMAGKETGPKPGTPQAKRGGEAVKAKYGSAYYKDRTPGTAPLERLDSDTTEGQKRNSWASHDAMLTYLISRTLSYVALHEAPEGVDERGRHHELYPFFRLFLHLCLVTSFKRGT